MAGHSPSAAFLRIPKLRIFALLSIAAFLSPARAQEASSGAETSEALRPERIEQRIFQQINQYRQGHDLSKLTHNKSLRQAAEKFARYMAETGRYGHTADGRRPVERAEAAGYEYCVVLENIAYQLDTRGLADDALAQEFTQGWIDSEEHRENILHSAVTETGIAIACTRDEQRCYAVQMFGRPSAARLVSVIENRSETTVRYRITELERSRQPDTAEPGPDSQEGGSPDEDSATAPRDSAEQGKAAPDRQTREFELPPRLIRKHGMCVPSHLEILTFDAAVKLDSNTRLTIVGEGDSLKLEQEPLEEGEEALEPEEQ